jgi:hypothetical protein
LILFSVAAMKTAIERFCDDGTSATFSLRPKTLFVNQTLIEMSTKSRKIMFMGSRVRQVREADNLTVICEPIDQTIRKFIL